VTPDYDSDVDSDFNESSGDSTSAKGPPLISVTPCMSFYFLLLRNQKCIHDHYFVSAVNAVCSPNEYQCENEECIRISYRCDGDYDCDDNSDEEGCSAEEISEFMWLASFSVRNFTIISQLLRRQDNIKRQHQQVKDH